MLYHIVNNLPMHCHVVDGYPFPFKFGKKLYVYEPYVDCTGVACWCRRCHDVKSFLAVHLKELL